MAKVISVEKIKMMKKILLLSMIAMILLMPGVNAQDACGTNFFGYGTTVFGYARSSVTPSTAAHSPSISSSTPSAGTPPTTSTGAANCFDFAPPGAFWSQLISTGVSDKILVNTPVDTLAIVNHDEEGEGGTSISEIRWYNQDGTIPTGLTVPEIRLTYGASLIDSVHTSVTDSSTKGDMVTASLTSDGDLHVGRYKANSTPTVWQSSFSDSLSSLYFIDYNPTAGVVGILAQGSSDIVVYTINVATGALINRVAVGTGSADVGHGIRVDNSGDVYVSYSAGFPGPYHAVKISGTTISWGTTLKPTFSHNNLADDNLVVLVGSSVYVGGNLGAAGAQIFRLSQSTGAADYQLDLFANMFLNGMASASLGVPGAGVYFYGRDDFFTHGVVGRISNTGPTDTWATRYEQANLFRGVAEGTFSALGVIGEETTLFASGIESTMIYLGAEGGGLFEGLPCFPLNGDLVTDYGGNTFQDSTFTDITLRTSEDFFDCFNILGDDGSPETLVYSRCFRSFCGDGMQSGCGEVCDDGNGIPGDGCEPDCQLSPFCTGGE